QLSTHESLLHLPARAPVSARSKVMSSWSSSLVVDRFDGPLMAATTTHHQMVNRPTATHCPDVNRDEPLVKTCSVNAREDYKTSDEIAAKRRESDSRSSSGALWHRDDSAPDASCPPKTDKSGESGNKWLKTEPSRDRERVKTCQMKIKQRLKY